MRGINTRNTDKWKKLGTFLVLLLVFGVLVNSVRKVYKKKAGADRALSRMEAEMTELENREVFLETSLARLQTEEGLKFEIRKKLNVAQVGESVAIIVGDETVSSTATSETSTFQKLKNFFGGLLD